MRSQRTSRLLVCEHCCRIYPMKYDNRTRFCSRACSVAARTADLGTRFWSKVARGDDADCWRWLGHIEQNGYGRIGIHRRMYWAHRVAWTLTHGEIPPRTDVCHRCDNPPCVNPAHLFLGSHRQNMADAWAKGRVPPPPLHQGERQHNAKLTAAQVREMRGRLRAGEARAALARAFTVSRATVDGIAAGKTWRHVT
jgi:hypothetical protein